MAPAGLGDEGENANIAHPRLPRPLGRPSVAAQMFLLTKWYLDLVTDQGTALIVYAASLEWASLRAAFASTLCAEPAGEPVERRAWSRVRMPMIDGTTVRFAHAGLHLSGEWRRGAASLAATMVDGPRGRLDWRCFTPNGQATVSIDERTITGRGYVECLSMSCPPWSLPLRSLRWGRYTSDSHSAVWIDWDGGALRRWVWFDGIEQEHAAVGADGISALGNGVAMRIAPVRTLGDRRALRVLSAELPALDRVPIGSFKNLRETKRLARGELWHDGVQVERGWVIDEVVRW